MGNESNGYFEEQEVIESEEPEEGALNRAEWEIKNDECFGIIISDFDK